ncbi:MAG: hypothetical protein J5I91_05095 [Bacteroidetes bacterium]|nr:hypothetical protein [Bacteroidota bacterium]
MGRRSAIIPRKIKEGIFGRSWTISPATFQKHNDQSALRIKVGKENGKMDGLMRYITTLNVVNTRDSNDQRLRKLVKILADNICCFKIVSIQESQM